MLYRYLLLTRGIPEEMVRRIVYVSFSGLHTQEGLTAYEAHQAFRLLSAALPTVAGPESSGERFVEVSGRVPKGFDLIQVAGDRFKQAVPEKDGRFKIRLSLKIGQVNRFLLYAANEETQERSREVEFKIIQTSPKISPEEELHALLERRADVAREIESDPRRLAYLTRTLERKWVGRLTIDPEAGLAALKKEAASCRSGLFKKVYKEILRRFRQVHAMEIPNWREGNSAYFFQKYTLYVLREMEEEGAPGAIFATEQGLGKTVTILSYFQGRNALVIAPNAVVSTWGEEAGRFFKNSPIHVIRGDAQRRAQRLSDTAAEPRVTNLEYLRNRGQDRFALMNRNPSQGLVVDECQFLTSDASLQASGARDLQGGFRILVSATPASKPERIRGLFEFLEGRKIASARIFSRVFSSRDPQSLQILHMMLDRYMIRFRKRDLFQEYDPDLPLEEQSNCLPRKKFVDPKERGHYELTEPQCMRLLEIFANWDRWQERHKGLDLTYEDRLIARRTGGFFSKREALRQLQNDPAYDNLDGDSPKHRVMDRIVHEEVEVRRGKLLIFCRYRAQVEAYARKYAKYGAVTYYGGTGEENGRRDEVLRDARGRVRRFRMKTENEYDIGPDGRLIEDPNGEPISPLDYHRLLIQNDPKTRILIATEDTGSVGVNFTAVGAVVHDDLSKDAINESQQDDRAHRIDNLRKMSEKRYYHLVSQYPRSFLEKMKTHALVIDEATGRSKLVPDKEAVERKGVRVVRDLYKTYFAQGTYDQVHRQKLKYERAMFDLFMDGIVSEDEMAGQEAKFFAEKMPFLFSQGPGKTD